MSSMISSMSSTMDHINNVFDDIVNVLDDGHNHHCLRGWTTSSSRSSTTQGRPSASSRGQRNVSSSNARPLRLLLVITVVTTHMAVIILIVVSIMASVVIVIDVVHHRRHVCPQLECTTHTEELACRTSARRRSRSPPAAAAHISSMVSITATTETRQQPTQVTRNIALYNRDTGTVQKRHIQVSHRSSISRCSSSKVMRCSRGVKVSGREMMRSIMALLEMSRNSLEIVCLSASPVMPVHS
jgi:hypothetical protein